MKLFQVTLASLAMLFAVAASADDFAPRTVPAAFAKLYIPDGFDDNDNVEIVGEGTFSNGCYRYATTEVQIDETQKTITLQTMAYFYDGFCTMAVTRFEKAVKFGILQKGTYTILDKHSGQQMGQLVVRGAGRPEPDDELYAPISQAFIAARGSSNHITLTGDFPLSCMKIKNIRTLVQPDVLIVQPTVEIDPAQLCNEGKFKFEVTKDIGPMAKGRYLLHVRSMNGNAVNTLFDVP